MMINYDSNISQIHKIYEETLKKSEQAELFWINTVKEYTNNKFEVEHIGKFNRAVITFNNE